MGLFNIERQTSCGPVNARGCESWLWLYYQQLRTEQIAAEAGTFFNTEEGGFGLIHKSAGFSGILYYFITNFTYNR
jgi:hypothetical protein